MRLDVAAPRRHFDPNTVRGCAQSRCHTDATGLAEGAGERHLALCRTRTRAWALGRGRLQGEGADQEQPKEYPDYPSRRKTSGKTDWSFHSDPPLDKALPCQGLSFGRFGLSHLATPPRLGVKSGLLQGQCRDLRRVFGQFQGSLQQKLAITILLYCITARHSVNRQCGLFYGRPAGSAPADGSSSTTTVP